MTTFTKELDDILKKRTWWGDYQNDDGTWGTGISNRPELIKAILNLVSERIIGENLKPNTMVPRYPDSIAPGMKKSTTLSAEEKAVNIKLGKQRTTLYEGTKEEA